MRARARQINSVGTRKQWHDVGKMFPRGSLCVRLISRSGTARLKCQGRSRRFCRFARDSSRFPRRLLGKRVSRAYSSGLRWSNGDVRGIAIQYRYLSIASAARGGAAHIRVSRSRTYVFPVRRTEYTMSFLIPRNIALAPCPALVPCRHPRFPRDFHVPPPPPPHPGTSRFVDLPFKGNALRFSICPRNREKQLNWRPEFQPRDRGSS